MFSYRSTLESKWYGNNFSAFRIIEIVNKFACKIQMIYLHIEMKKSTIQNQDLINTVCLRMPPLRERRDDILMLAEYFLKKFSDIGVSPELPENAKSALVGYSWPGNVRELQNIINRFLTRDKTLLFQCGSIENCELCIGFSFSTTY